MKIAGLLLVAAMTGTGLWAWGPAIIGSVDQGQSCSAPGDAAQTSLSAGCSSAGSASACPMSSVAKAEQGQACQMSSVAKADQGQACQMSSVAKADQGQACQMSSQACEMSSQACQMSSPACSVASGDSPSCPPCEQCPEGAAAMTASAAKAPPTTQPDVATLGLPAPGFELLSYDGKKVSLGDFAGKIVVLEWTNWDCPFIKRHGQAGTSRELAAKYKDKGVVWLAVNSTKDATSEQNRTAAQAYQASYPILMDPDGKVGHRYAAKTTPHMFVIDRSGTLAYDGAIDDDPAGRKDARVNYVDQAIGELLAGKAVTNSKTKSYGCGVKYAK